MGRVVDSCMVVVDEGRLLDLAKADLQVAGKDHLQDDGEIWVASLELI